MEHDILDYAALMQCQELHINIDPKTGLKAVIAIHNTVLGPALGGCRCIPYVSTEAAIVDAIRLAQGMTYKAAIANLRLGGGKTVLLKPEVIADRTAYFKAFGRFVNALNGRYITAVDSGTSVEDMDNVATETQYVTTTTHSIFSLADPSVLTALGVQRGIEAAVKFKLNQDSLKGIKIAIQGLGHAGYSLAKRLKMAGAELWVYDLKPEAVERAKLELQVQAVSSLEALLDLPCDVFAPSALGAIINDETIERLKVPIVAGCANNQLDESRHGAALMRRGILYAPDYVINAGGLIYVAAQCNHITEPEAYQKIEGIYHTLMDLFQRSEEEKKPTNELADCLAMERIQHATF